MSRGKGGRKHIYPLWIMAFPAGFVLFAIALIILLQTYTCIVCLD